MKAGRNTFKRLMRWDFLCVCSCHINLVSPSTYPTRKPPILFTQQQPQHQNEFFSTLINELIWWILNNISRAFSGFEWQGWQPWELICTDLRRRSKSTSHWFWHFKYPFPPVIHILSEEFFSLYRLSHIADIFSWRTSWTMHYWNFESSDIHFSELTDLLKGCQASIRQPFEKKNVKAASIKVLSNFIFNFCVFSRFTTLDPKKYSPSTFSHSLQSFH